MYTLESFFAALDRTEERLETAIGYARRYNPMQYTLDGTLAPPQPWTEPLCELCQKPYDDCRCDGCLCDDLPF